MAVDRIRGARELSRLLKKLPNDIARREARAATRAGAIVIRKAVKRAAPAGRHSPGPYGKLRDNIRVSLRRTKGVAVRYTIHTGRAFWGRFIEFGTRHQAARPFFRPAFAQSAAPALSAIAARLEKGINKQARALAGRFRTLTKTQRRALRRG